jgi:hypothetical protein
MSFTATQAKFTLLRNLERKLELPIFNAIALLLLLRLVAAQHQAPESLLFM